MIGSDRIDHGAIRGKDGGFGFRTIRADRPGLVSAPVAPGDVVVRLHEHARGVAELNAGEVVEMDCHMETAYLLMAGEITFSWAEGEATVKRNSIFDEDPYALHIAGNRKHTLKAVTDCELAMQKVENEKDFETILFDSSFITI